MRENDLDFAGCEIEFFEDVDAEADEPLGLPKPKEIGVDISVPASSARRHQTDCVIGFEVAGYLYMRPRIDFRCVNDVPRLP